MDQMMPFLSNVCRGGLWGLLMGSGLGTLTGIVSIHRTEPPKTLPFQHPLSGHVVQLDTYGLDEDQDVVRMLRRVRETLQIEPSIRPEARRQFAIILARVRNFYNALQMYTDRPDVVRYKIHARQLSAAASQTIRNFESYIWDSPEIEGILNDLEIVQSAIVEKMLSLDSMYPK